MIGKLGKKTLTYSTALGQAHVGNSMMLLEQLPDASINLVMTSPPFALQRKKEYGNKDQTEYVDWFLGFAEIVKRKLRDDGSFVVDLGGSYEKGVPTRSLYNFRLLIRMVDEIGFKLAEDFYWFNPSKLPSPIEWVNKRKLRAKDSINTVWWFSKTDWPKADVSKVLAPYSDRMKKLLEDPDAFYTPKGRPSGHDIGKGFGKDNGGSIPSNLLQIPNSESNGAYMRGCKLVGGKSHPARFPAKLPEFFIKMLTEPGDTVVDIFSGSNTTGQVCEELERQWLGFDLSREYVAASAFRFMPKDAPDELLLSSYAQMVRGEPLDITKLHRQQSLFAKAARTAAE
jgi:site-specific DNA-methyltransferase (cytosine-N4-specific)